MCVCDRQTDRQTEKKVFLKIRLTCFACGVVSLESEFYNIYLSLTQRMSDINRHKQQSNQ